MRARLGFFLLAAAATAVAVIIGIVVVNVASDSGESEPPPPPPFTTTPLEEFDTSDLAVARGPFCDRLDPREIEAAVGGAPTATATWTNGDTIELGEDGPDVVHEFGCEYTGAEGTVARAWVFAAPIDPQKAGQLVQAATADPECQQAAGAPPLGAPSVALTCTGNDSVTASHRGLLDDSWVVCEITRPSGALWDVADRVSRWCVGALRAMRN